MSLLAKVLFENHGLTLQQHKTKILNASEFRQEYLVSEDKQTLDNLSAKFDDILSELGIDGYSFYIADDISEEVASEIDQLNLIDVLLEQVNLEEIDSKLVSFVLHRLGKVNNKEGIDICIENIDKLYTVFKSIFIYINDLQSLTKDEKSQYGSKILEMLGESLVGHLEYHTEWVFSLFGADSDWNSKSKYVKLYREYQDEFSRRQLLLALGRSKASYWFKSQKREITRYSAWERRAFIAAANCLPGDEAKHWFKSIKNTCDILDECVYEWGRTEF